MLVTTDWRHSDSSNTVIYQPAIKTSENEARFLTYVELGRLREQERQRAELAQQQAERERQRAERLAAQLRELGIPPENGL